MKEKFMQFMRGRYGVDQLSKFMMIVAVVLVVVNGFLPRNMRFIYILGWAIILIVYFRMFSRDSAKRSAENQKFLQLKQRKNYHIYKCPTCKQKIRIPRGKGKIEISCPTCHTKFVKRS